MALFDLMPTVLELAGVRPKFTHFATSLVPQLMGGAGDSDRRVYSEGGFLYPTEIEPIANTLSMNPSNAYYPRGLEEILNYTGACSKDHWSDVNWAHCHGSPRAVMVRSMKHKLVYRPDGVSELFDSINDPKELTNLWDDGAHTELQQQMLEGLLQWYVETTDVLQPLEEDDRDLPPVGVQLPHHFDWESGNPLLHPELQGPGPLSSEEEEYEEALNAPVEPLPADLYV